MSLSLLIEAFLVHPDTISGLKSSSAKAYARSVKDVLLSTPGKKLTVAASISEFLSQVKIEFPDYEINDNQACALRRFYRTLQLPLTISCDIKLGKPLAISNSTIKSTDTSGPVILIQPISFERKYMRSKFIGRLKSQERYYPNLFVNQPDKSALCIRYPGIFFCYDDAPHAIRMAIRETIQTAVDNIIFYIAALDNTSDATVQAVPFSAISKLVLLPADLGAYANVYCSDDKGTILEYRLMQRVHRKGAPSQFELFHLNQKALVKALNKSKKGRRSFEEMLFTNVSLDHAVPFFDTLRLNVTKLDGLLALTKIISQRGGPSLDSPSSARFFEMKRELYHGLCITNALPDAIIEQLANEIRFLDTQIDLEIISSSNNSKRGANSYYS